MEIVGIALFFSDPRMTQALRTKSLTKFLVGGESERKQCKPLETSSRLDKRSGTTLQLACFRLAYGEDFWNHELRW